MKTLDVSLESFEPVTRRGGEITQRFRIVQYVELPGSDFPDGNPPSTFAKSALLEEPLDRSIGEALDRHGLLYLGRVYLIQVLVQSAKGAKRVGPSRS